MRVGQRCVSLFFLLHLINRKASTTLKRFFLLYNFLTKQNELDAVFPTLISFHFTIQTNSIFEDMHHIGNIFFFSFQFIGKYIKNFSKITFDDAKEHRNKIS
jgi:hypothetical protein